MQHIGGHIAKIERNIELVTSDPVAQHGFTQVPNFLFKSSGLSMGAIVVYSKFLSYAWHNDFCFPGQERLSEELAISRRSVVTWVQELERAGLLEITRRGQGHTNIYRLSFQVKQVKPKKK